MAGQEEQAHHLEATKLPEMEESMVYMA